MREQDFDAFSELWAAAYEAVSRGKVPSDGAVNIAFDALRLYELKDISAALTRHVRDPDHGQFGLVPADVVRQIDGPTPTADQIIGAALNPNTPLAVLCAVEIGSSNLGSLNYRDLRPYAQRCITKLPEWRERLAAGQLAEHERHAIERRGITMENIGRLDAARRALSDMSAEGA